jgi:hypothetical protein
MHSNDEIQAIFFNLENSCCALSVPSFMHLRH